MPPAEIERYPPLTALVPCVPHLPLVDKGVAQLTRGS